MASHVVSFLRRSSRAVDWTSEELAELYRIEHALVQANIRVETDRGLSDEDDPWFVFCRADGEVLVHISRYDGQYRLHSPGLSNPLIGQSFVELAKSFTKIVPIQVSIQRREGAQLFIHPAAMLAAIVGTLFVAADDLRLFSSRHDTGHDADSATARSDDTASAGGPSLKFALQAAFDSYINAFIGSLREMAANESSYYLALIGTVTAFVLQSAFDTSDQLLSAIVADSDGGSEQSSAQGGSSVPAAADAVIVSKLGMDGNWPEKILVGMTVQQAPEKDAQAEGAQKNGVDEILTKFLHVNEQTTQSHRDETIQVYQDDNAVRGKLVDAAPSGSDWAADRAGNFLKWASLNTVLGSSVLNDSGGSTAPTAAIKDMSGTLLAEVIGGNPQIDALLAHAPKIYFSPEQNPILASILINSEQQGGGTVIITSTTTAATSGATTTATTTSTTSLGNGQYAVYDAAAQATLINFLNANPQAEVFFDHNNFVVYDLLYDSSSPIVVRVWELEPGGATISIVGHANHGLVTV